MSQRIVKCAKLGQELPAIDESTPDGGQAIKMALLLGGPALRDRIRAEISDDAWQLWKDRMLIVINEYRLDPTSEESNAVLREHMEAFLFGDARPVDNYVPPSDNT